MGEKCGQLAVEQESRVGKNHPHCPGWTALSGDKRRQAQGSGTGASFPALWKPPHFTATHVRQTDVSSGPEVSWLSVAVDVCTAEMDRHESGHCIKGPSCPCQSPLVPSRCSLPGAVHLSRIVSQVHQHHHPYQAAYAVAMPLGVLQSLM